MHLCSGCPCGGFQLSYKGKGTVKDKEQSQGTLVIGRMVAFINTLACRMDV